MTMRWIVGVLLLGATLSAQQAPVFRAGVDLVTLRVVVVDQKGQPVKGLTEADFNVRLEGQVRPVRVLNYLEVQESSVEPIEARRESTNIGQAPKSAGGTIPSRLFVLLFDDLSFRHTSALMRVYRDALDKLLAQMTATDKVGLLTTSGRVAPFGPTADWDQVRARLAALRGYFDLEDFRSDVFVSLTEAEDIRKVFIWEEASALINGPGQTTWKEVWERECLIAPQLCEPPAPPQMYFALKGAANNALAYTQQQTSIQIRGFTNALRALASIRAVGGQMVLVIFSEGLGSRASAQSGTLTRLSQTVAEAGATMYVVTGHPDDITIAEPHASRQRPRFEEQRDLMDGLEDLAGATGATIMRPIGQVGPTLTRILSETSGVYELAVEAPPSIKQRTLTAQVTVNRKDAVVRMGRHVVSPSEPPPIISIEQELTNLVMKGGGAWSVPMSLGTTLRRDQSRGGLQLGVNLVIDEVAKPPFRVRISIVDTEGRVVTSGRFVAPTHTASFGIEMPAGLHRLRVAAADSTDAVGAIEHPVVGRLSPIGQFFASDLLLASEDAAGNAQLLVIGQVPPETVNLNARLELYASDVSTITGVQVRVEVGPPGAAPLASVTLPTSVENGALVLAAKVPLAKVPPGSHVVTAVVLEGGQEVGRVNANFTLRPRAEGGLRAGGSER
jgi:VWFA-related protein